MLRLHLRRRTTLFLTQQTRWLAGLLWVLSLGLLDAAELCLPGAADLIASYRLNDSAADQTGRHPGVLSSRAYFTNGVIGRALFPNAGGVRIANHPDFEVRDQLTVSAWVRGTNVSSFSYIVSKTWSLSYSASYAFYAVGGLYFYVTTEGRNIALSPPSPASIWDNQWHHAVGTYDGKKVRLFVDGKEMGAGSNASGPILYTNPALGGDLIIGGIAPDAQNFSWPGAVDEVSVFKRPLSLPEIVALGDVSSIRLCQGLPDLSTPPRIVLQPQGAKFSLGNGIILNVQAEGTGPLNYRWLRNGQTIPGATQSQLRLDNARIDDGGRYQVIVENSAGSVLSETAVLTPLLNGLPWADLLAQAGVITGPSGTGTGNNQDATLGPPEREFRSRRGGRSLWLRWTAPQSGALTLTTAGSDFDTLLGLYRLDSQNAWFRVGEDDDGAENFASSLARPVLQGVEYYILVDGRAGATGTIAFQWNLQAGVTTTPQVISQPRSSTAGAGAAVRFTTVVTNAPVVQWYKNGVPLAASARVSGVTSPVLDIIDINEADLGRYRLQLASGIWSDEVTLQLAAGFSPGQIVPTYSASDKLADILDDLETGVAPARLPRERQAQLAGLVAGTSGTQIFSTAGSRRDDGEPVHCGVAGGASQWLAIRPDIDGPFQISTAGSAFDTVLAVYRDTGLGLEVFDGLTSVACNNDAAAGLNTSFVEFQSSIETVYFIAVDGVGGATGTVKLSFQPKQDLRLVPVLERTSAQLKLRLTGALGQKVRLETSDNLKNWTTVSTIEVNVSDIILPPVASSGSQSYYRVVTQ